MLQRAAVLVWCAVLLCGSAAGDEPVWCGTGPATAQRLARTRAWLDRQPRERMRTASAPELRDGIFIVPADDRTAPHFRPFDLEGRSLTFTRQPAGFTVTNTAAVLDGSRGVHLPLGGPSENASYRLKHFRFPFGGLELQDIVISGLHSIHATAPRRPTIQQYDGLELTVQREPIIAPLLTTISGQTYGIDIYVHDTTDSVSVTWAGPSSETDNFDVRATLFRNGDIRFTYAELDYQPRSAGIVISSGADAWASQTTALGGVADDARDVPAVPAGLQGLADIRGASVQRIGGLDLVRFDLELETPVDLSRLGSDGSVLYYVDYGPERTGVLLYGDGRVEVQSTEVRATGAIAGHTDSGGFDGKRVFFYAADTTAALAGVAEVTAGTFVTEGTATYDGDRAQIPIQYVAPSRTALTDFCSVAGGTLLDGPIAEAFTRASVMVHEVWQAIRDAHQLSDADWEAVAIYPAFATDLDSFASGYSTVGTSGVKGVGLYDDGPRTPALMHLNSLGNLAGPADTGVLALHELGHRWLFFTRFVDEAGTVSDRLNPAYGHPAQHVDTSAAFRVVSDDDTSCMGGGHFTDHGNGSFTGGNRASFGYSWLDLYLMGLAAPEEVPPWFYIENSNPFLGGPYWPPPNVHVTGERKNVTIQQVIAANGPRVPAYPAAPRRIRVAFVLVSDPRREVSADEMAEMIRAREKLQSDFRAATGGRGEVVTDVPVRGGRRRAVRH